MNRRAFNIVNGITIYRIVAAPILLGLVFYHQWTPFKWLLALSFLTDAIDGYLARKFKVISSAGATLDSVGDDLTVFAAIVGLLVFDQGFIRKEAIPVGLLLLLYLVQITAALIKYRKLTSFHTWLAKIAAVLQGSFLILAFFLPDVPYGLFWVAAALTGLDLLEEIILVFMVPDWKRDVKGLYMVLGKKNTV